MAEERDMVLRLIRETLDRHKNAIAHWRGEGKVNLVNLHQEEAQRWEFVLDWFERTVS